MSGAACPVARVQGSGHQGRGRSGSFSITPTNLSEDFLLAVSLALGFTGNEKLREFLGQSGPLALLNQQAEKDIC